MTPARRGRRDNGLDAALWSPLRDVDPRVGEHLLDVLQLAGIPAYLEPSADVGPYTRTVFLPSPPTDRLYVDRSRRAEARELVDRHADDHVERRADDHAERRAPGPVPERAAVRRNIDEDAEWARIVAAFEAEEGRPVADGEPSDAPPPPPHEPSVLDRPDEHYEPPPAPPLGVPAPAALYAVLLVVAGVLLVGMPGLLRLSADVGLVLGVAAIAGGVALLVSRMRERSVDDGDDGAVV
ncbi:hypothetical protein OF117_18500 [Geodermatophilus sp. YIM 151500]|uniref:hypothetical protein n=1 Tax=Geodermatophilus sp. YIM 151500 TaxID=2984531 RepID=UPI0021E3C5BE|nr:hypothetical protein [Geodermatophilus sp. YIM 151500]MCV2491342.1 hypothetical protein [Geodermatophilus sp. YIM 151500]